MMPSETDAALVPFAWSSDTLTRERLFELAGADVTIEQTTLAELFHTVPGADRVKFTALANTLEKLLANIKATGSLFYNQAGKNCR